jgi:hypothetical protein
MKFSFVTILLFLTELWYELVFFMISDDVYFLIINIDDIIQILYLSYFANFTQIKFGDLISTINSHNDNIVWINIFQKARIYNLIFLWCWPRFLAQESQIPIIWFFELIFLCFLIRIMKTQVYTLRCLSVIILVWTT